MIERSRWEVYHGTPNRMHSDGLRVTMNARKVILLNRLAYDAIGGPPAVELRYDERTRTIGLFPCDMRVTHAFPLRQKAAKSRGKTHNYMLVYAAPFCRHHRIGPDRTIQFTNVDLDKEGTLLLELNTTINIGRGINS